MTSSAWRKGGPLLVAGLGLSLLGSLWWRRDEEPRRTRAESRPEVSSVVTAPTHEPAAALAMEAHEPRTVVAPRAVAPTEPVPRYAHPTSAEHARLYRDVDRLEAVKGALARRDFATARAILAQHRVEFPNGYPERVEGYEIIADCLEHPGPETTARAQRYHDEKRASIVRRQVRKACLPPRSQGALFPYAPRLWSDAL